MIHSEARTFALESLGVPAGRRAFLKSPERLDYIDSAESLQCASNQVIEPTARDIPALVLLIIFGLAAVIVPEPIEIVR